MMQNSQIQPRSAMEIFVFKTNINAPDTKPIVEQHLQQHKGISRWSIDYGDRDKVLRVEAESVHPSEIIRLIHSAGFRCEELS